MDIDPSPKYQRLMNFPLESWKDELLANWKGRVLSDQRIPQAKHLPEPVLLDHLPDFIDSLAQALDNLDPNSDPIREGRVIGEGPESRGHAQLRSKYRYELTEALLEFSHFRIALMDTAEAKGASGSRREWRLMHTAIDACMAVVASEMQMRAMEFEQRLIGIVSHDLCNPLNSIAMCVRSIHRQPIDDVRFETNLKRIEKATNRSIHLIQDLLDFSRARIAGLPIHPKTVDFFDLVSPFVTDAQQSGQIVRLHTEGNLLGTCDPDRMSQVVQNLISNAVQHSYPQHSPIDVTLTGTDDIITFKVQNKGYAPPELAFEAFQRGVATQSKGLGLGLYIARHIVEGHGGKIGVHFDGKVAFEVTLPRNPPFIRGTTTDASTS